MFYPKFVIYHANSKGTGSKIELTLVPTHAKYEGAIVTYPGYVEMTITPQRTVGGKGEMPTFDDDNSITANLCYDDVCHILQVLRGETEQIRDGQGLYHSNEHASCRVNVRHLIDPYACYRIIMEYKNKADGDVQTNTFTLTQAESCGLCEALSMACFYIVFGNPKSYTNN